MALVSPATCPTCGQAHNVVGMRSVYAPTVELCLECIERNAAADVGQANEAARWSARTLASGDRALAEKVLRNAEHQVMVRMLCKGNTDLQTLKNLRRYWERVRAEVES